MKKTYYIGMLAAAILFIAGSVHAATTLFPSGGGTGTSTIPTYGKVLVGNAGGTYSLMATSSLGISAGSSASTTLLTDANTFSGVNLFTNSSSNFSGTWQTFSPSHFLTAAITGLKQTYGSTQTGATQTFATSSDTNIGLTITNSTDAFTWTPTWIGTLADARITSAATWNAKLSAVTADAPLSGAGTSASHLVLSTAGTWSGLAGTATALAANGTNCSAGNYPLGVDASGNAESCTAAGTGTVTSVSATYPVLSTGGATPLLSLAFGTTTSNTWAGTQTFTNPIVIGALSGLVAGNSGTTYAVSTSTLSASSPLTGSFVQLGNGGTLGCQTASGAQAGCLSAADWTTFNGKGSGTVTAVSVASANGFTGSSSGGATPALTLTTSITGLLKGNGTALSAAAYTDFPTIAANTVLANGTGATAAPTATATSSLFAYGPGLTQSSTKVQQIENRGFSYATSTAWTGTTTISLGIGYGEVWNTIKCYTDVGTLNVDFYHGSSHFNTLNSFNASTTIGTITAQQNTTDTVGDKVKVDIGTPATSPTTISCTVNDTI